MPPKQRGDDQQRHENQQARDDPRGHEDAEAVEVVVDRLEQELVDEAVADFLADLVVLVEGADEELQRRSARRSR